MSTVSELEATIIELEAALQNARDVVSHIEENIAVTERQLRSVKEAEATEKVQRFLQENPDVAENLDLMGKLFKHSPTCTCSDCILKRTSYTDHGSACPCPACTHKGLRKATISGFTVVGHSYDCSCVLCTTMVTSQA